LGNAISYIYGWYPSLVFFHHRILKDALSGVTTFRTHLIGGLCEVHRDLHARIFIFSTFIMDLVLLAFMFTGILHWKGAHGGSRTWWFLYKQVSIPQSAAGAAVSTLIL
jgi:hypothetical protein